MSQKRLQIVIISADFELEMERRLVGETLVRLGAFVSGFSFLEDSDTDRLKLNQKCLADADYAIVLTNLRYAPLSPGGAGFVHQMFAAVQAKQIPVLSLVYKGVNKSALNADDYRRQQDFVSLLKEGNYYEWHNYEGLRHATEKAFQKLSENYQTVGWHRSLGGMQQTDAADSNKDLQIRLLRQALEEERGNRNADADKSEVVVDYVCKAFYGGTMKTETGIVKLTWNDVFLTVGPQLLNPTRESNFRTVLCDQLLEKEKPALQKRLPQAHAFVDLRIQTNVFNMVKVNLTAQGMIELHQGLWQLTPFGEHRLMRQATSL